MKKKISYQQGSIGLILIAISILLKYVFTHYYPISALEFLRGVMMGIGVTLIVMEYIKKRKQS